MIDHNGTQELAEALSQADLVYIVTVHKDHATGETYSTSMIVGEIEGECPCCVLAEALCDIYDAECETEDSESSDEGDIPPPIMTRFLEMICPVDVAVNNN